MSPAEQGCLLVTGGGRGIGAAVVRQAACSGRAVCFSYLRDVDAATNLRDALRAAGGRVECLRGDVADPRFATQFFDLATEHFGTATALVNNAGITGGYGPLAELDLEALRRTIDTNLLGTLMMAREAVRRWQAAGIPGCMVNIGSIAATLGAAGEYVHYAATKAAVEALTIGLGKEVADSGIRINAVSPGTVLTDIHAAAGQPDRPARVASRVPMGRVADPREIAAAVLWLLSAESSYVTGTVLRVTGGL